MSLTRKDFRTLAEIVKELREDFGSKTNSSIAIEWFIRNLTDFCDNQNPRFNRSKFLDACGVEE